ncbi:MAG: metalloregulator ArsR/SmtB family transcription factor [Dehalococcoidia bacterium]
MPKPNDAYAALADPTRRAILGLLRDRETLTPNEIASHFPQVSRAAVSKHLGVLRRAMLVHATQSGREQHYRLQTSSLAEIYEGWLATFAPLWDESLARLRRQVEQPDD